MKGRRPTWDVVAPVVGELCGSAPAGATAVDEGGYSRAGRWLVRWGDGRRAFVKAELDFKDSHGLALEHRVYAHVGGGIAPRLLAYAPGDGERPRVLVTEDLSEARWGVPLSARDAALLGAAMDELATLTPPPGLPPPGLTPRWAELARAPTRLLESGLLGRAWLERHADALAAAEAVIDVGGAGLVHCDVWLQNWCRAPRGAVLVDWAGCAVGDPMLSRAWGEAGVRAAGGPPGLVMRRGHVAWAVWMAGQAAFFQIDFTEPPPPRLAETERREAVTTLRWACDELGIEAPEPAPGFMPEGPWRP